MKIRLLTAFIIGCGAFHSSAQTPPNAPVPTTVVAESSVQYSATAPTGFTNYIGSSGVPYDKVKYSTTAPCKSYFKFDFTGLNPNTNFAVKFSFSFVNNNGQHHLQLWALNQSYPTFITNNPSLAWATAQANDTASSSNDLMTTGAKTATLITDFIDGGGNSGSVGVTLPAPWSQFLLNNQVVIVLTGTNDTIDTTGSGANGARFNLYSSTATYQPLTPGTLPPNISAFTSQTVKSTASSGNLAFTVSDPLDAAASLTNITVTLGNTNVTLSVTNISIGAGGSRTLSFIPINNLAAGTTANVTVTVSVTDSLGNSTSSSFQLTVTPLISLPVVYSGTNVNYLPPTNRVGVGSVTIPFQVVDTNITAAQLVLAGAASAYSTNIGTISFTQSSPGSNTNNCTVTVNAIGTGVGIVNISAIDPANSVTDTVSLAVMVLPNGSYAVYDMMNYQPSTSYSSSSGHTDLANASSGLWAPRSTSGSVNLITSKSPNSGYSVGVPTIRGTASGNQNQLRLAGAPYTAGSHKVIYASIYAQWADLSFDGANQYFPSNSTGGFVEFAADASATGVAMAQICTVVDPSDNGPYTGTNGAFYLGLYNGTNNPSTNTTYWETIPNDMLTLVVPNPTPDNIVMSYDVDTGISTLWVNQSSSTGASVNLQDIAATNLANVSYLVLRQNAGMGNVLINSATVKVVNKPFPTITGITKNGNTVTISYTDTAGAGQSANQQVWSSASVNGTYSQVSSGVTITDLGGGNYSVAISGQTGQTQFYKIKETGTVPSVSFPF